MLRLICLGMIAILLSPLSAWSQDPPEVVPGSRIRITDLGADRSSRRSGRVLTAGADTVVLSLDTGGEAVPFPLAGISQVEVSRGERRHVGAGIGLGLLIGAGAGALLVASDCEDSYGACGPFTLIGGAIGGGAGMVVGGVIGALRRTERWEVVPPSRWHVSARPSRGGSTFVLSLRL
jgi:hypothetical protein